MVIKHYGDELFDYFMCWPPHLSEPSDTSLDSQTHLWCPSHTSGWADTPVWPARPPEPTRRTSVAHHTHTSGGLIWGPLPAKSVYGSPSSLWSNLSSLFSLHMVVLVLHATIPRVESTTRLMMCYRLYVLAPLLYSVYSLCYLPSSLAAARFSERSSHLTLRTLYQAIESAPNSNDPVGHRACPSE